MKKKLGERLKELFKRNIIDETFFEDLEDALIEGDIGAATTMDIVDALRDTARERGVTDYESLKPIRLNIA